MPTNIYDYKDTLLKIEQNDNTLTGLSIGEEFFSRCRGFNLKDEFLRLGKSIGTNTHLTKLVVSMRQRIELDVTHREFFEGLTKNNSLTRCNFCVTNIMGG